MGDRGRLDQLPPGQDGIDVLDPSVRREEWRTSQRQDRVRPQPLGQAAPGPVLGAPHDARGQRVSLDVTTGSNQGTGVGQEFGLEPALVHGTRADALTAALESNGISSCYPVHEA